MQKEIGIERADLPNPGRSFSIIGKHNTHADDFCAYIKAREAAGTAKRVDFYFDGRI